MTAEKPVYSLLHFFQNRPEGIQNWTREETLKYLRETYRLLPSEEVLTNGVKHKQPKWEPTPPLAGKK